MTEKSDILRRMRENPKGVKFKDLCKIREAYFGVPRQVLLALERLEKQYDS